MPNRLGDSWSTYGAAAQAVGLTQEDLHNMHPPPVQFATYHNEGHSGGTGNDVYEVSRNRGHPEKRIRRNTLGGLLHDGDPVDPEDSDPRKPGTPARASVTIERLYKDRDYGEGRPGGIPFVPGSKESLTKRLGIDGQELDEIALMIRASEYPFDTKHAAPAYEGTTPAEVYENELSAFNHKYGVEATTKLMEDAWVLKVLDQAHYYLRTWPEAFRGTWGVTNEYAELDQKKYTIRFFDPYEFMTHVGTRDLQVHIDIANRLGVPVQFPTLEQILDWRGASAKKNFNANISLAAQLRAAIDNGDYTALPWPIYTEGEEPVIHPLNLPYGEEPVIHPPNLP